MKTRVWLAAMTAMAALALGVGCGDGDNEGTGGSGASGSTGTGGTGGAGGGGTGAEYYSGPEAIALGAAGNKASCATCHSNDGTQMHWSGNTFKDIAYRSNFKGGMAPDLLAAANECVVGWMGGTALTATDPKWMALEKYMQSLSSPSVTEPNALVPEVLANEAAYETAYAGGTKAAGEAKFKDACGRCHDTSLVVNTTPALPTMTLGALTIGRIAQKVRTSGPPPSGTMDPMDTTPGPMPFFEEKDLSTQDLKDIIAFLKP